MGPDNRKNYRILIVDDEPTVRKVLNRRLSREGYQCEEAECTSDAAKSLNSSSFDLVLLDINMPGQSGLKFLPELINKWPDVWVMMITAVINLNTAVECMRIGAADYITKPFDLNHMALSVKRVLGKKEKQSQLEENRKQSSEKLRDIVQKECKLRERFLHSVAHEIRTPLTSILCSAELLKADKEADLPKDNILNHIIRNCQRVNEKLSDIKVLDTKNEDLSFDYKTLSLRNIINQAIKQVDQSLNLKKQAVRVELPPDLPSIVSDDRILIRIFSSLLSHCITHSPFGSSIILRVTKVGEELLIEIVDESLQVNAIEAELLFQPCYQREMGSPSSETGFGIELALAAKLASSIGGELWFNGETGCSMYVFALPVVPIPEVSQQVAQVD